MDGVVIVTSPQDLVSMIVTKAVRMAEMMHIPVLGFVENYSYLECPGAAGKQHQVLEKATWTRSPRTWACLCWHGCPLTPRLPRPMTMV